MEDLAYGDVTTDALPGLQVPVEAMVMARQDCRVSGLDVVRCVFQTVDPSLVLDVLCVDGDRLVAGQPVCRVSGHAASILKAERTALNFLQHLSGIATTTGHYADAIAHTHTKVTDTRKTTPGLRWLEKKAVVHGGGSPHRFNLGTAVMIKDNHIQAVGSIAKAVASIRQQVSHTTMIEVEVDTLAQLDEALNATVDIILLDNMSPDTVKQAVKTIGGKAISEASGNITLATIAAYAETGVDYISTSKLTLGLQ